MQTAIVGALTAACYYLKDEIHTFFIVLFHRKVRGSMRMRSFCELSNEDEKYDIVKRYLDEICMKNTRCHDLQVYTPGKQSKRQWYDIFTPTRLDPAVKKPDPVAFRLSANVWYHFQYAPYVMQNPGKIKLWKISRADDLERYLQLCERVVNHASSNDSHSRPSHSRMYDVTMCDTFTKTLSSLGLLQDVHLLLIDIESDVHFPRLEYVKSLLRSINRALADEKEKLSLLSRIISMFFVDNRNQISYFNERVQKYRAESAEMKETLHIETSGIDNSLLRAVVHDALKWHFDQLPENKLRVYVLETKYGATYWKKALDKEPRRQDSVIFQGDLMKELLEDVQNFFKPETVRDYNKKGIPHRRGYMLHGPPGCGKTSFITVLASELDRDLAMIDVSSNTLDDKQFAAVLREAPSGSIIVLEDVDAMFHDKKEKGVEDSKRSMKNDSKLSFSGLLNAIDGVASQEGCILVMTTNHPERLDPAFIRPGRVDVMKEIKNASQDQLKNMFLRFYNNDATLALQFSVRLPGDAVSMAKLQGFFVSGSTKL